MQVSQQITPENGHVAVFAFPYHGRLPSPALFDLTTKLAAAIPSTFFSFFGTANSIHNLSSTSKSAGCDLPTPSNLKAYATLVDGLQPGSFKTPFSDALKGEAKTLLSSLTVSLNRSVRAAREDRGREVTCLVTDVSFASEVDKLAHEMGIHWVAFSSVAPHTLTTFFHLDLLRRTYVYNNCDQGKKFPKSDENLTPVLGLSIFRVEDLSACDVIVKEEEDKVSFDAASWLKENLSVVPRASAIVFSSFEELNPALLVKDIESTFKRVLYVGALTLSRALLPPEADEAGCLSWLDKQKPGSVVFISFGTEGNPPQEEITALAEALQASGVPFLWSIKDDIDKENLPNSNTFLNGKVVFWAPQRQVLAHSSVVVCVSHGGYDSVMESIVGEVVMIVRPVCTDNKLMARLVTEVWGIGVRAEGGIFTKSGMIKSLEMVFGDHGKMLMEKIKSLKELVLEAAGPSGSAATHFQDLVGILSAKS